MSQTAKSSDKATVEKTEVLHGVENIINITLQHFSTINERLDACGDAKAPSLIATTEPIKRAIIQLCNRGARHRLITEITKDNISYCKQIMGFTELRHLDEIKGNFAVSEKSYHAMPTFQEVQLLKEVIISTVRTFVEQQYFFETLWNRAILAKQRIKEIE